MERVILWGTLQRAGGGGSPVSVAQDENHSGVAG